MICSYCQAAKPGDRWICRNKDCKNFNLLVTSEVVSKEIADAMKPMTRDDQLALFARDLNSLMERYAQEFDLRGVEVIGVLECAKHRIAHNITMNILPPKQPPSSPP